jgi:two-component system chemotaxis response regulator CheB
MTKRIRVMIIEDSAVIREYLTHIIGEDPRLEVAAAVDSAEEAIRQLNRVAPDVISLDIRLPGMNGLDATLQIMAERPTPIVVISADVDHDELNISMNALRAGALSVVEKPVGVMHKDYKQSAKRICDQLAIMSSVKVVKQRFSRQMAFTKTPTPPVGAAPSTIPVAKHLWRPSQVKILGVVASTGGPSALATLFQGLPAHFPVPILLVQHITPSFLESFAGWLQGITSFKVDIAQEGELPLPGHIYMAPVDRHLEVVNGRLRLSDGPPLSAQRPSGTTLLKSIAKDYGESAIGVILTGMGDDGALGMVDMKNRGAYTLAEDESTCVVYGMPAMAVQLGGACESLPLPSISNRILELMDLTPTKAEAVLGKRI